jgi:ribosomal protein L17
MRHGVSGFKLGRLTAHRWAMFRNLLVALFRHERIMTTEAKAKAMRGLADQMVTLAKRDNLHARRQVLSMVILELVDRPEAPKEKGKKDAKAEKAPRGEAEAGASKGRRKKAAAAAS